MIDRHPWHIVALWLVAAGGCDLGADRAQQPASYKQGSSQLGGTIVSTVNGYAITLADVGELVELGMSAEEGLRTLQAELLLIGEAERRGFAGDPAVRLLGRQAGAQALLDAEAEQVSVSEPELRAAYEAAGERFVQPEKRASFHVLAQLDAGAPGAASAAAEAFTRSVIGELRAEGIEALRARYNHQKREHFTLVAQAVPPAGKQAAYDPAYLDALFSLPGPGVVARPVRSRFGWHAIVVTDVLPSKEVPFEVAREQLAAEIQLDKRARRVETLLQELGRERQVELADGVGDILATVEP
jgi:hypothetical protein